MKSTTIIQNIIKLMSYQCWRQILYKYGPVMTAIWSFMDLTRWSRGQYCCWRYIIPILPSSIFALLYVKCLWVKPIGLWIHTYIVRLSLIIYYHSLFYSLGHGATIVISYCPIMTSDTIVAPEWHFYQTIVQYDVTIVQDDITIVAPWWENTIGKYCLVNMVFWVSMHYN